MEKKKIMVIFGTRPEATKMATVIKELKKYSDQFETLITVTGQHNEQLYQVLNNFDITPDIDLKIMKENQSLVYITNAAIKGLDEIIQKEKPDFILVHGDTQTSFAGALTGFLNKIPVAHIEAGLRSFNRYSPWPEEINRKLVDVTSNILFAPTRKNYINLLNEGYEKENIFITGQTAIDAALSSYDENHIFKNEILNKIDFKKNRVIFVTAHRRENYGEPMHNMFNAIRKIADDNQDVLIIYPVHLSPVVRKTADKILKNHERIILTEPIDYLDSINLQAKSYFIMSDSGGLQEEASVFKKTLILMRDTTERPEAVETGFVFLAGTNTNDIYNLSKKLLNDKEYYNKISNFKNPFGDGKASERIVKILSYYFKFTSELPEEFGENKKWSIKDSLYFL